MVIFVILLATYYASGYAALIWEYALYELAARGFPMSIAMHRSMQVSAPLLKEICTPM